MAMLCCANQNHGQDILHDLSGKQTVEPLLVLVSGHVMLRERGHFLEKIIQGVEEMPKGGNARDWFSLCFCVRAVFLFLLCCSWMFFLRSCRLSALLHALLHTRIFFAWWHSLLHLLGVALLHEAMIYSKLSQSPY